MRTVRTLSFVNLFLLCSLLPTCLAFASGFTAGLAAIGSLAFTSFDAIRCRLTVCCNERWIPKNMKNLEKELSLKLHGQHLVRKAVISHLKGHFRSGDPAKALVLSFHGPTGVGKNFVSRIIAENVFKEGLHSPYVHLISATKEFPHEGMVPFYKDQLKSWIEGNVTRCAGSMFIFDEVDKLPPLLLDVIKPYLDYYPHLAGVDYRKAIFLFLCNTGGSDIAGALLEHWRSGKKRESLQLSDLEKQLTLAAVNAENHRGLWHSQLISNHLITAAIPFLPLEKPHIRECIKDSLQAHNYYKRREAIPDVVVNNVMKELNFMPENEQLFSNTGCKRVSEKVDFVMADEEVSFSHHHHVEI